MLGEILSIQPGELKFPLELRKQVSTSLRLVNVTSEYVAFKVKTTNPKKYCVRPNTGLVPPQSSIEIVVTMQAQKEIPSDMQCKDKFLVQSVLVPGGTTKEASQDYFSKENGREIHEVKLRVIYVAPPQPPSPVAESAEEGVISPSPFPATSTKSLQPQDPSVKDAVELRAKLTEAKAQLTQLSNERATAMQELHKVKHQHQQALQTSSSGWSSTVLLALSLLSLLIGIYLGYRRPAAA